MILILFGMAELVCADVGSALAVVAAMVVEVVVEDEGEAEQLAVPVADEDYDSDESEQQEAEVVLVGEQVAVLSSSSMDSNVVLRAAAYRIGNKTPAHIDRSCSRIRMRAPPIEHTLDIA